MDIKPEVHEDEGDVLSKFSVNKAYLVLLEIGNSCMNSEACHMELEVVGSGFK